ncbi:MAG: tRNA lysidine(34) synthetase TilS [Candidatus Omnitrophica bacterium]|nr:tRNA lysidine(34) synthetase TilS [Candidatus Omnitrophota bacterium]
MENLLSRIESTIQKHSMVTPGERILVACSGGADSIALFHLLGKLAPRLKLRLNLLHFDHALRKGSEKDLEFVRMIARKAKAPFYGKRRKANQVVFQKGLSPEESARESRYQFFEAVAKKTRIRKIALGHHLDDQAETVLMRMIQGTGLRGLQGIRPVMKRGRLTLIRPLIELSRKEIREFLKERKIRYREDETNRSQRFLRNRIRHLLIPLLEEEFNPQIREALGRLAETVTQESAGLDDWIKNAWKKYLRSRRNGTVWLDREAILLLPAMLQFRLLDYFLHLVDPRSGLDYEAWGRIEEGLRKRRFRISLPRSLDLLLTPKKLTIKKTG